MFFYGFGLAFAFVGLAVLAGGVWFLARVVVALNRDLSAQTARLKALEEKPVPVLLTREDVARIVSETPAWAGPQAVPLDQLPRNQMPDQVAVDTFTHAAPRLLRTPGSRIAAFEAQQRKKAADARGIPQGGPGASE